MTEVIHRIKNFHCTYLISEACKKMFNRHGRKEEGKEGKRKEGREEGGREEGWFIPQILAHLKLMNPL